MNIAVIFAGGVGARMKSKGRPKQFLELYGKPIIIYTLEHFENNEQIDAIAIACVKEWIPYLEELIERFRITKVKKVVPGGSTGQESIYCGLKAAEETASEAGVEDFSDVTVLIHDGVRPVINSKLIDDCIESTEKYGSAITTAVVKETVILSENGNLVDDVPSRAKSRIAKAPQCFRLSEILAAHEQARAEGINDFIDCCTMLRHYGKELHIVEGPYENIKITTPDDYYTLRALLEAHENAQVYLDTE